MLDGRFRLIPRSIRALPELIWTDIEWETLALPINLAFFVQSASEKRSKAMYPSPAGATESLLPLTAWDSLLMHNLILASMEPDVEALLVNRVGTKREYYLAPIDVCFELVGLIRVHWRGFSGGEIVWEEGFGLLDGPGKDDPRHPRHTLFPGMHLNAILPPLG